MEEEASTSHVAGRITWPAGLRALEEQKKKVEEEREREAARQPQEQQQQQQQQQQERQQQMPRGQQQQRQGGKKRDRSRPRLKVCPNQYHRRCKSLVSRKKIWRCTALRPQRGSFRGRLPRSG